MVIDQQRRYTPTSSAGFQSLGLEWSIGVYRLLEQPDSGFCCVLFWASTHDNATHRHRKQRCAVLTFGNTTPSPISNKSGAWKRCGHLTPEEPLPSELLHIVARQTMMIRQWVAWGH